MSSSFTHCSQRVGSAVNRFWQHDFRKPGAKWYGDGAVSVSWLYQLLLPNVVVEDEDAGGITLHIWLPLSPPLAEEMLWQWLVAFKLIQLITWLTCRDRFLDSTASVSWRQSVDASVNRLQASKAFPICMYKIALLFKAKTLFMMMILTMIDVNASVLEKMMFCSSLWERKGQQKMRMMTVSTTWPRRALFT